MSITANDFTVCQTVLGAGADGRADNDSDWVDGCGDCLGAKPYMDVVMVEKNTMGSSTFLIPLLIIVFSLLQSLLTYSATYLNIWVGQRIAMDVKKKLFYKLMHYNASFFDKNTSGDIIFRFNNDVDAACAVF